MRLALVPLVSAPDPLMSGKIVARPDLPASLDGRYGQASSLWAPQGMVLVWLDVDETEALALAASGVGIVGDYVRWTAADQAAMRRVHPKHAQLLALGKDARLKSTKAARRAAYEKKHDLHRVMADESVRLTKDCVSAYREVASVIERQHFGDLRPSGIVALTVLHTDTGNRADTSDIDGSTFSDGVGVWAKYASAIGISSNKFYRVSGVPCYYDSVMSSVDVQRASVTTDLNDTGAGPGPGTRIGTGPDGYFYYPRTSAGTVFRLDNGSLTSLGNGGVGVAGDVASMDSDGNSHSGLLNGSVVNGPHTDSNYTTGVCGVAYSDTATTWDDFVDEVAASGVVKTVDGVAFASVKTWNGVAIASVKTINGAATA